MPWGRWELQYRDGDEWAEENRSLTYSGALAEAYARSKHDDIERRLVDRRTGDEWGWWNRLAEEEEAE